MTHQEEIRKGSQHVHLAAILENAAESGLLNTELTPGPPADFVYITRNGCSTFARI